MLSAVLWWPSKSPGQTGDMSERLSFTSYSITSGPLLETGSFSIVMNFAKTSGETGAEDVAINDCCP